MHLKRLVGRFDSYLYFVYTSQSLQYILPRLEYAVSDGSASAQHPKYLIRKSIVFPIRFINYINSQIVSIICLVNIIETTKQYLYLVKL